MQNWFSVSLLSIHFNNMSEFDALKTYLNAKFSEVGTQLAHGTATMGRIQESDRSISEKQTTADAKITTNTQAIQLQKGVTSNKEERLSRVELTVLDMQRRSRQK